MGKEKENIRPKTEIKVSDRETNDVVKEAGAEIFPLP
jgi:hypothetical protein